MSFKINIHDAKTNFSRILSRVKDGEEIIIANAGEPIAKIIPYKVALSHRKPGSAKNRVSLSKNFDKPLPDKIIRSFEK